MLAVAPRPGLIRPRTGTIDITDRYEHHMLTWRDALVRQGKDELSAFQDFQRIEEYIKYLDGKFYDRNRPAHKSKFFDNYLADMRREALSSLSQVQPALDISSKVPAYKDQSKVVDLYVRNLWNVQNLDLTVVEWVDHALFGTGFVKHTAAGDRFYFSAHGPDQVMPVLCNGDLQESAAVIYTAYKPISYFLNKFGPDKCRGLEREAVHLTSGLGRERYERPNDIPEYRWDALSPRLKRRVARYRRGPSQEAPGAEPMPFPVIPLMEVYSDDWSVNESGEDIWVHHPDLGKDEHNFHYIVPPGCRIYPRKRLTIFAGNRIMYDGPAPFWHGLYPFIMLQLNPCVWNPGGISKYRDLLPLVKAINRIGAGVDDSILHALNRILVGKRGSMPQDAWDAIVPGGRPGDKWLLNPIAQKGDVYWMEAPQVPSYVGDFLKYLVDTVKRRSGSLDIQGISRKKQVPGGDAIEQMRDSLSAPFQLEERYLEAGIGKAGEQVVSNVFQYATLDGRLRVLGGDGVTWSDFDYSPDTMVPYSQPREDHWKTFSVRIAPGSGHGSSKQQKKTEAFTLYKAGGLSLQGLYEAIDFPADPKVEMQRIQQERSMGIGVQGKQPRQNRSQRQGQPI